MELLALNRDVNADRGGSAFAIAGFERFEDGLMLCH